MTDPDEPLRVELHFLKRRGAGLVTEQDLGRRTPVLLGLARAAYGRADAATVRRLLIAASDRIAESDLRAACQDLFGLTASCARRTLRARQEVACGRFDPPPAVSTFRQQPRYTTRIVEALLQALPAAVRAGPPRAARPLVDRAELSAGLRRLLDTAPTVVIHGDAGMGKTELALSVAASVTGRDPAEVVRVRLGNSKVSDVDVRQALAATGQTDVDGISDAACRQRLQRWLTEPGRDVLVLDGAASVSDVEPYLPGSPPAKKVLVTSRLPLPLPHSAAYRVTGYHEAEAVAAVRLLLPDGDDRTVTAIATALAAHPLAIDHVCRYIAAAEPDHLGAAVEALATDPAAALGAIEASPLNERQLTRTYRRALAELDLDGDAPTVLDFALVVGSAGSVHRATLDSFLAVEFPGAGNTVRIAAALRSLAAYGLLAADAAAYTLHPLTFNILARLRDAARWRATERLIALLAEPPAAAGEMLHLMARELRASAGAMSDGPVGQDDRLLGLNEHTWLQARIRDGETTVIRYRVEPDRVIIETAAAEPRPVTLDEGKVLYRAVKRVGAISSYVIHPHARQAVLNALHRYLKAGQHDSARALASYAFEAEPQTEWIRQAMGSTLLRTDPRAALRLLTSVCPPPHDGAEPGMLYDLLVGYALTGDPRAARDAAQRLRAATGELHLAGWRVAPEQRMYFADLTTPDEIDAALTGWLSVAEQRRAGPPG